MKTKSRDAFLRLVLRGAAVAEALAIAGVLMPTAWMAFLHERAGLGEFPASPVVPYMARMVSGLYVIHAGFFWILAGDPVRFRPLILFMAVAGEIFSAVMFATLVSVGFPAWWIWTEGLFPLVFYAWLIGYVRYRSGVPQNNASKATETEYSGPQSDASAQSTRGVTA